MLPNLSFHRVTSISLTPIDHYPKDNATDEFWCRNIVIESKDGKFNIPIFSYVGPEAIDLEKSEAQLELDLIDVQEKNKAELADAIAATCQGDLKVVDNEAGTYS